MREFLHVLHFGHYLGLLHAVGKRAFRGFQLQFEHALGAFQSDTGKADRGFQVGFIECHNLFGSLEHLNLLIKKDIKIICLLRGTTALRI